jgi:integrase
VGRFAAQLERDEPYGVTPDDVAAWFAAHEWARDTRRAALASVRGFYRWARLTARTVTDPTVPLGTMPASPPAPKPIPDYLYREALVRATPRVRLMLRLAGNSGLRRGEVAQVHARDLVPDLLGYSLHVHGKGGKDRVVPLDDKTAGELETIARGGFAFPGRLAGHIQPRSVGVQVTAVLPGHHTMHSLRHRCATAMYGEGHDLLTIAQILGHASVETTRRYIQTPDDARRRLVSAVAL